MLCLGGIYSWSIFAAELMENHQWSSVQTQLVLGLIITVFPTTMLLAGRLERKMKPFTMVMISALSFGIGYLIAGYGGGGFIVTLTGLGIFGGIGTGFGYSVAISTPVKWFPERKGLITGIAAAGFGLASVVMSNLAEHMLLSGKTVFQIFSWIGIVYGLVILSAAFFMKLPPLQQSEEKVEVKEILKTVLFYRLLAGIFFGTFAGLLVIGNLSSIGAEVEITENILVLGVSIFAITNFLGRLGWGIISDHIGGDLTIFLALLFQAVSIFLLGILSLTPNSYLIVSAMIGFGFGSNFVLFAKETSHQYGVGNFAVVYSYVFLGYAVAGIFGPFAGGLIYDISDSYLWGIILASGMSLAGASMFLFSFIKERVRVNHPV